MTGLPRDKDRERRFASQAGPHLQAASAGLPGTLPRAEPGTIARCSVPTWELSSHFLTCPFQVASACERVRCRPIEMRLCTYKTRLRGLGREPSSNREAGPHTVSSCSGRAVGFADE